ncbi:hypothetical protein HPB50_016023 [Hyalomma asiaticum]|uniref:Uncharacterized protein n=1 Tax=Hyalomma asiaticum TaxID=266040 RepID=A0ACB7TE37_HYAAI|nr:hypothetical protein HPB50_016023 [Hyalomma asiaticum]
MDIVPAAPNAKDAERRDSTRVCSLPAHQHITCTKRGEKRCHLLDHLPSLNKVLLDAGLELCEDSLCVNGTGIRIAIVQASGRGYIFDRLGPRAETGLYTVQCLLTGHRCITTVEVNRAMRHHPPLIRALNLNRAVENVVISGMDPERSVEDEVAFKVIKTMSQLKRLFFDTKQCPSEYANMRLYARLLKGGTRQLTTLDVADADMSMNHAKWLIRALTRSTTVERLVVGENVFTAGKRRSGKKFENYLVHTKTLRTLRLTSKAKFADEVVLRTLIGALCQMQTLEELEVDLDLHMVGFAARVSLFAEVVAQNATLSRLRLPSLQCACVHRRPYADPPDPDSAEKMAPWLLALRNNRTLRELEIDLGGFAVPECRDFFDAVGDNDTLSSVVVRRLPSAPELGSICKTIRERGLTERVRIDGHHVGPLDYQALPDCPEITSVTVNGRHFDSAQDLDDVFETLAQCPHVTTLRVNTFRFDNDAFECFADYMAEDAEALTVVDVTVPSAPTEQSDEAHLDFERRLLEAVVAKPNLAELSFTGILLYNEYCDALATAAAAESRWLTSLQVTPASLQNPSYGALFTPEERTRTPRRVECAPYDYWSSAHAAIRKIPARNRSYVSAAARYVLGSECDDGAKVLEVVHDHPWLVNEVRRRARVGTAQAKAKIASAMKRVRTCDIDEYMRLAGVVKAKVECAKAAGVQIANMDEYCWIHIRSFLKIADVVGALKE